MTAPKHVAAVLMSILILFLRQVPVHQLVNKSNFDDIKMHGTNVKIMESVSQSISDSNTHKS